MPSRPLLTAEEYSSDYGLNDAGNDEKGAPEVAAADGGVLRPHERYYMAVFVRHGDLQRAVVIGSIHMTTNIQ